MPASVWRKSCSIERTRDGTRRPAQPSRRKARQPATAAARVRATAAGPDWAFGGIGGFFHGRVRRGDPRERRWAPCRGERAGTDPVVRESRDPRHLGGHPMDKKAKTPKKPKQT